MADGGATERAFPSLPSAGPGSRVIASPFQFVTTGEDALRVVSVNSLTGVRVKIHTRRVDAAGRINAGAEEHIPNTDRTVATSDYPLGVGALLNLAVFATGATPKIGQTFVIVQIIRGTGPAAIVLGTVLQGYVTSSQGLGWPGSPIESSIQGGGAIRTVIGTQPAAGVAISETVPSGARWELLSLFARLDTNAGPTVRTAFLRFKSGSDYIGSVVPPISIPASVGAFCSWGAAMPAVGNATYSTFQSGTPQNFHLLAGVQIVVETGGFDVGDQWQNPVMVVREWLEVP